MFSLQGVNALVTGASGGIGGVVAACLAKQGATVVLSGTRQEILQTTADAIKQEGGQAHVLTCDLFDETSVEELFPKAESLCEKIDIVVNNAGITRDSLVIRMKDEDWQAVIDVNLSSTFRISRAALKAMMKRRYGRIINIASIVGVRGNLGQVNYCAAKAGLIGMSKGFAQEAATRGITVNCVAPGFIETPMTKDLPEAIREKMLSNIPMGAYGKPDDIGAAVAFLASREAGYVTGQTIHVNGGMLMV